MRSADTVVDVGRLLLELAAAAHTEQAAAAGREYRERIERERESRRRSADEIIRGMLRLFGVNIAARPLDIQITASDRALYERAEVDIEAMVSIGSLPLKVIWHRGGGYEVLARFFCHFHRSHAHFSGGLNTLADLGRFAAAHVELPCVANYPPVDEERMGAVADVVAAEVR